MKLVFEPAWPWPIILLFAAALWGMVAVTYPRRVRHLPTGVRRFLIGARYAVTLLLLFTMVRPALEYSTSDKKDTVILIGIDVSRSMSTRDGPGGQSRFEFLKKTLQENEPAWKKLGSELEIRKLTFDEAALPIEELPENPTGNQSAIGELLKLVPSLAGSKRVAALFLLSDGAHRALPPHDADPRTEARVLGQQEIPIYPVPFGSSGISENAVDLSVEDLLVDSLAFEKKLVPLTFKVRALGAAKKKVQVRILIEDRNGVKIGSSGELKVPTATSQSRTAQEIEVKTVSEVIPVELSFVPDQVGEFKIAVEVVPLDGELKIPNNRIESILTVQKGGINIAYFDSPRPEQRWIRLLNTSEKIQLDFDPIKWRPDLIQPIVNPEFLKPGKYDVYLIGDVPAAAFGADLLRQLAARVDEGAGLMMIGGVNSFGAGGYASTPLVDLLPVAMRVTDRQDGVTISPDLHFAGDQQMLPTEQGLDHYLMMLDRNDNRGRWESLPPLMGVNKLRPKNDAVQILAETDKKVPLLLAQEVGKARVLAFAGDTTYLWQLSGFETFHQRFWRQVIFWLAHKEFEGDQPVWVRAEPRVTRMGGGVELILGARNEDGSPMPEAQFEVEVINPKGESTKPTPQRTSQSHRIDYRSTQIPGDYWVRVSARKDGNSVGPDAYTRFIIKEQDLELDNPSADPTLLNEIAALSGGSSIPPESLADFIAQKQSQGGWNPELIQHLRIPLYDNWWVVMGFVSLLSSEWLVRKLRGLV
ncbi:MAG: glutamine amidotransferase [Planctomycetota bacterium]|nr:glutamine amidotransferase [Planctomycetota bacterium]MDA1212073.1 glutamine amidotransferase [Planctomycetota bacterium]